MAKLSLAALVVFVGVNAQAGLIEIKCQPNPKATTAQFIMIANLVVTDDDSVSGSAQYATRSTATAQTSDVRIMKVVGHRFTNEAGEITTNSITTYHLFDESDDLVRVTLNPDMSGPISSTLMIDRKFRYSSQCKLTAK